MGWKLNISIISKNKYYINEIGHQCWKKITTTWLNETWYGSKSRSTSVNTMKLSKLQCQTMVESEYCDNNKMTCNQDACWYDETIIEKYHLNEDIQIQAISCTFIKKQIIAEHEDSQLYFSPNNNCRPRDGYCQLFDSVIIWENATRDSCLYSIVHKGSNYVRRVYIQHDIYNLILQ